MIRLGVPSYFIAVALDEGPGPPLRSPYTDLTKLYAVVSILVRCCDLRPHQANAIPVSTMGGLHIIIYLWRHLHNNLKNIHTPQVGKLYFVVIKLNTHVCYHLIFLLVILVLKILYILVLVGTRIFLSVVHKLIFITCTGLCLQDNPPIPNPYSDPELCVPLPNEVHHFIFERTRYFFIFFIMCSSYL